MVEKMLEMVRPLFVKGGKLESMYPLFEAGETFMLTSDEVAKGRVHVRDQIDSKRYMIMVVMALMPPILFGIWNAGYQANLASNPNATFFDNIFQGLILVGPIIFVSYSVGGAWEGLFAMVRKHEINEGFLVTGMLFPLTLPPTIPLWQVALGISFGVVIGKEVFGGTGMNIFNPALTARAFVFFCFPKQLSGQTVWAAVDYNTANPEAITGATPLLAAATAPGGNGLVAMETVNQSFSLMDYSWLSCFIGTIPGSIGETSTLACLLGAAILIATGIGSWRTMVMVYAGATFCAMVMSMFAGEGRPAMLDVPFYYHWVIGSLAFGAVYMATDPVSSPGLATSKYIYGFLIGVVAVIIRSVNPAYPEGVMLAILFMNAFAPTIDYFVIQANVRQRKLAHAK